MRIRYSRKDELAYREKEIAEKTALQKDLSSIRNLMDTMSLTAEGAMKALKIPTEKFSTYAAML